MKRKTISELVRVAQTSESRGRADCASRISCQDPGGQTSKSGLIFSEGVLESFRRGTDSSDRWTTITCRAQTTSMSALSRSSDSICEPGHGLRTGPPAEGRGALLPLCFESEAVNFESPEAAKDKTLFDNLTPLYPMEKLNLEMKNRDISTRIIDLLAPSERASAASSSHRPKAGKTMILQKIANSITENHPEVVLIVLLIDERPEEVTDMERSVQAEVISSTFDEPAERHVQVAEMVIEKHAGCRAQTRLVILLGLHPRGSRRAFSITSRRPGRGARQVRRMSRR